MSSTDRHGERGCATRFLQGDFHYGVIAFSPLFQARPIRVGQPSPLTARQGVDAAMDHLVEASGWIASGCVLAAFLMRRMRPLRLAAIASNAAFIVYAVQLDLLPILLLHAALLPINLWRLREQGLLDGTSVAMPRGGWASAALVLAVVLAPRAAIGGEASALPAARISLLEAGGLRGSLLLPAGRPPGATVMVLPDSQGADPRSAIYVEQLLGSGLAVFDVPHVEEDPVAVAALPSAAGLEDVSRRFIRFGAGARRAGYLRHGVSGRVLLYPGCAGVTEVAATNPVLVLHEEGDESNTVTACTGLAARLAPGGRFGRRVASGGWGYGWDYPAKGQERWILLPRPDGDGLIVTLAWSELADFSASQVAGFFTTHLPQRAP